MSLKDALQAVIEPAINSADALAQGSPPGYERRFIPHETAGGWVLPGQEEVIFESLRFPLALPHLASLDQQLGELLPAVRESDELGQTRLAEVDVEQLRMDLVAPILRRLLAECTPGSASFRQADFDQAVEAFYEYHRQQRIPLIVKCGLVNAEGDGADLALGEGLRLVGLPSEERARLWARFTAGPFAADRSLTWKGPLGWHYVLERRFAWHKTGNPSVRLEDTGLLSGVHALRLTREGSALPSLIWLEPAESFADFTPGLNVISGAWTPTARAPMTIEAADESRLRVLVERLAQTNDRKVALILRIADQAAQRTLSTDRILDYWIALEALFVPDENVEITYKASRRIARFVGDTRAERLKLVQQVILSYSARSAVIHGTTDPQRRLEKKKTTLAQVIEETHQFFGRAVVRWLDPDVSHDLKQIDADLMN